MTSTGPLPEIRYFHFSTKCILSQYQQGVTRQYQETLIHNCPLTRHGARMVRGLLLPVGGTSPMGGLRCQKIATCTEPSCDGIEKPLVPIVAREENKIIVRRPYNYKSHKCEKCEQVFNSNGALGKHIASIHTVKILEVGKGFRMELPIKQVEKLSVAKELAKEDTMSSKLDKDISLDTCARQEEAGKQSVVLYKRSEQAEKEDEARRENSLIRSSDRPSCRFCKSNTFLHLECPERKKKAPVLDVFDAEAFLETEFR